MQAPGGVEAVPFRLTPAIDEYPRHLKDNCSTRYGSAQDDLAPCSGITSDAMSSHAFY
jgi:hypothetical protein